MSWAPSQTLASRARRRSAVASKMTFGRSGALPLLSHGWRHEQASSALGPQSFHLVLHVGVCDRSPKVGVPGARIGGSHRLTCDEVRIRSLR